MFLLKMFLKYLDDFRVTAKSQESLLVNLNYNKMLVYGAQMSSFSSDIIFIKLNIEVIYLKQAITDEYTIL